MRLLSRKTAQVIIDRAFAATDHAPDPDWKAATRECVMDLADGATAHPSTLTTEALPSAMKREEQGL